VVGRVRCGCAAVSLFSVVERVPICRLSVRRRDRGFRGVRASGDPPGDPSLEDLERCDTVDDHGVGLESTRCCDEAIPFVTAQVGGVDHDALAATQAIGSAIAQPSVGARIELARVDAGVGRRGRRVQGL